jgi:virginiamycin B lyase
MRGRLLRLTLAAIAISFCQGFAGAVSAQGAVPLSGQVRVGATPVAGILVSAKRDGGTITVSVVSDAQGKYSFPSGRLTPGRYALSVRGGGFVLAGPPAAEIAADQGATIDLDLRQADDLGPLLADAEWLASIPGTDAQKSFLTNCIDCHTLQRIVSSNHTADAFVQIFQRMSGYAPGSSPLRPQLMVGGPQNPVPVGNPRVQATADYLASINLSTAPSWQYKLKLFDPPAGKAARAIITEYDLPHPEAKPHDVIVDRDGAVWYSDFGAQSLGELDPKTGNVTEHAVPTLRQDFPKGTFDLESDQGGNLWIALMYQGGVARYDRAAKSFTPFPIPAEWQTNHTQDSMVTPTASQIDGKVWTNNQETHAIYRLDVASGVYENFGALKVPGTNRPVLAYGMPADRDNNLYLLNFAGGEVVKLDAKTKELSSVATPTANSRPYRGRIDGENRLWFTEFAGNAIAMLDPKTGTIQEWKLPTPWSVPADVVVDKNGMVWAASMLADRIARLDPKSGEIVEYALPRHSSVWRIFVDNTTNPVSVWVGSDHGASIIRLETLD